MENHDRRYGRLGEVRRREIRFDKSWDRLFDGEIGLSVEDCKKVTEPFKAPL
jgi:hypothetical protein